MGSDVDHNAVESGVDHDAAESDVDHDAVGCEVVDVCSVVYQPLVVVDISSFP